MKGVDRRFLINVTTNEHQSIIDVGSLVSHIFDARSFGMVVSFNIDGTCAVVWSNKPSGLANLSFAR